MRAEPVQDFILQDPDNMRIAAAVSAEWMELRTRLANGFRDKLGKRLLASLPGWTSDNWKSFFADPWPGLYLFKPLWVDQYYVTLQANEPCTVVHIGIQRAQEHIAKRPHDDHVLDALRTIYPSAKASLWWEAEAKMRSPAADWSTPEVLWRMHKEESFLEDVARHLLEIAKLAEPLIDDLVRKA